MLGGLGKELRRCGVDCLILENHVDHIEAAKIARREDRYVLTSGQPYQTIRAQLPGGRCIHVSTSTAKEQCSFVMKAFNVAVTIEDLFSRCRACNTGSYTVFNQRQAKALWFKYRSEKPDLFAESDRYVEKKKNFVKVPSNGKSYELSTDKDLMDKIDTETYHLRKWPEVRVQLESIFDTTLQVVDTYYVCNGCGHIYWEGPHWQNIETRFAHVLDCNETNNSIQE